MRPFVSTFLLPLVRGGAVHVSRPLGHGAVDRLVRTLPALEPEATSELAVRRQSVAARILPAARPPELDEATVRLGAALHDLLALAHPGLAGAGAARRQASISTAALELASVGPPASARQAVDRHSLLARLPEIVRVDRTVHFWLGRQTFVGRRPPRRVMAMPAVRRVRIERTDRGWLREIGIPAVARPAFLALSVASPLGEALDPLRLDPPVAWGRILPVLRHAALARAVAGRALEVGLLRAGDALAEALYRFASFHDPPIGLPASAEAIAFALRFLAHLVWLDVLFGGGHEKPSDTGDDRGPGSGTDFAVVLTAAARTHPALVWPGDAPKTGSLADAFRARLELYAARAERYGRPRYSAALGIAELAS
jgi:hypothetical protein